MACVKASRLAECLPKLGFTSLESQTCLNSPAVLRRLGNIADSSVTAAEQDQAKKLARDIRILQTLRWDGPAIQRSNGVASERTRCNDVRWGVVGWDVHSRCAAQAANMLGMHVTCTDAIVRGTSSVPGAFYHK